jgi:hypothetical protein
MNRSSTKKMNKEAIGQMNLTLIYRTLQTTAADHRFLLTAQEAFFNTGHMVNHNTIIYIIFKNERYQVSCTAPVQ